MLELGLEQSDASLQLIHIAVHIEFSTLPHCTWRRTRTYSADIATFFSFSSYMQGSLRRAHLSQGSLPEHRSLRLRHAMHLQFASENSTQSAGKSSPTRSRPFYAGGRSIEGIVCSRRYPYLKSCNMGENSLDCACELCESFLGRRLKGGSRPPNFGPRCRPIKLHTQHLSFAIRTSIASVDKELI